MKIPKQFIYFLVVAQIIITASHVILYYSLLFFFPTLHEHALVLLIVLMLVSFSFLVFSVVTHNVEKPVLRWGYILSAMWMPTWLYLIMACLLGFVVYIISPSAASIRIAHWLIGIAVIVSLYGAASARVLRTTSITVTLPGMPLYWKNKTAVLVTDIHLGHVLRYGFAGKVITAINHLKPDIIFIAGDFFDGVKTNFSDLAHMFKSLEAKHGVYFCSGNHEQFAGYELCEAAIRNGGITILENEKIEIEGLQIAGLAYFPESQETEKSIGAILASLHLDSSKPSILLKHVPNLVKASADAGISLQLSGHTHHGQVWPGRFITRRVYEGFDNGLKKIGNFQIYTSSGAGTWGPPMRPFTKSEIVKINFE